MESSLYFFLAIVRSAVIPEGSGYIVAALPMILTVLLDYVFSISILKLFG